MAFSLTTISFDLVAITVNSKVIWRDYRLFWQAQREAYSIEAAVQMY